MKSLMFVVCLALTQMSFAQSYSENRFNNEVDNEETVVAETPTNPGEEVSIDNGLSVLVIIALSGIVYINARKKNQKILSK